MRDPAPKLCTEEPFATWRAALRQPGAVDYRGCNQHGAWHVVTSTSTSTFPSRARWPKFGRHRG